MRKILITGGAGFIGSSLASEFIKDRQNHVVIIDNLLTGKVDNIPKSENCTFIDCDVNEMSRMKLIMAQHQFDYVFHYAAVVGVKRTLNNPLMVLDDIEGLKNIFELSAITGVKRLFYSSSSEVYGEPVELPQNELTTPLNSKLPYSIVKNLGESFCKIYQKEYGLDYTILRFFNTYGPRQSTDFVMSKFIKFALNNRDINIYGDGLQSRTFCYIDDNIGATVNAFNQDKFVNDIVNIGSNIAISIEKLARTIIDCTGSKSKIKYMPPLPEGDMTRRLPDITKMNTLLKKNPIELEEGIERIINAFQSNGVFYKAKLDARDNNILAS